jgi:2-polyprenyl-6-methoxyphenol hydroxylase-like FAD-dependent oxidoreductase
MTRIDGAPSSGLRVAIAGGAIAGCAAAIELSRLGCEVSVFERSLGQLEDRGAGIASSVEHLELLRSFFVANFLCRPTRDNRVFHLAPNAPTMLLVEAMTSMLTIVLAATAWARRQNA